jgi:hypothetical protein
MYKYIIKEAFYPHNCYLIVAPLLGGGLWTNNTNARYLNRAKKWRVVELWHLKFLQKSQKLQLPLDVQNVQ